MHPLPSCFQRRITSIALALLVPLACDRQKGASPPADSIAVVATGGVAVDTAIAARAGTPSIDTAIAEKAASPRDSQASARAAHPAVAVSRPKTSLDRPTAIASTAGASRSGPVPAPATDPATTSASRGAPAQSLPAPPDVVPTARRTLPFMPGEKLAYDVRFGPIKVGTGTMEVSAIDTVRAREVFHTTFRIKGGTLIYKVHDRYESWFDTQSLISIRYRQQIDEGSYERERTFEIFPERAVFSENGKPEQTSVTEPMDDGSFIYFIRSIPLEVGKTYEFNRYFRPDRNPVTIRVLRRERVRVPAGSFDAIVVRPVIKAKGIFSEGGKAELWLADDSTRVMLQLQSKLSFGSLNLYLTSIKRP